MRFHLGLLQLEAPPVAPLLPRHSPIAPPLCCMFPRSLHSDYCFGLHFSNIECMFEVWYLILVFRHTSWTQTCWYYFIFIKYLFLIDFNWLFEIDLNLLLGSFRKNCLPSGHSKYFLLFHFKFLRTGFLRTLRS